MEERLEIKKIEEQHLQEALDLVWKVFVKFEANKYSKEGVAEFKNYIDFSSFLRIIKLKKRYMWGCFDGEKVVGVIGLNFPSHITLLFVDEDYHLKGIATQLYKYALDFCKGNYGLYMTVNSSAYAVEFYEKLGFIPLNEEQTANGIRFTPMKQVF